MNVSLQRIGIIEDKLRKNYMNNKKFGYESQSYKN